MPRPKRGRVYRIPDHMLLDLLRNNQRITNLPDGAILHAAHYDFASMCFKILVEHESYAEVEEATVYPSGYTLEAEILPLMIEREKICDIVDEYADSGHAALMALVELLDEEK